MKLIESARSFSDRRRASKWHECIRRLRLLRRVMKCAGWRYLLWVRFERKDGYLYLTIDGVRFHANRGQLRVFFGGDSDYNANTPQDLQHAICTHDRDVMLQASDPEYRMRREAERRWLAG